MKTVQLLLKHGSDIRAVSVNGWSAMHFAAQNHQVDLIERALESELDIESRDNRDHSPIHFTASVGSPGGCELLLRCGAMLSRKSDKTGMSPSSAALFEPDITMLYVFTRDRAESKPQVVHVLLEYGARLIDNVDDKTILERA